MQVLALRINSTTGDVTDFTGQQYQQLSSVHGDVVLIAAQFDQQDLDGSLISMDLSAALALRAVVGQNRQEGTTILAFEDTFNQGQIPLNEDLATGKVTWLLALTDAAMATALDTNEFVDVILEFTTLTADNYPQTIAQIAYRIYAQVDDGAVGVPPPTTPTYMTAAAASAAFVAESDYIVPATVAINTALASVDGIQKTYVDTSGGDINITLPLASTADVKYCPEIINLGGNKIKLYLGGADKVNDTASPAGEIEIISQYGAIRLIVDGGNNRYIAPTQVTP